ncbi:MAG: Fic family protein [Desulfovibrio sp.]|nr:Fic family protein [Desulfovibrio sp.]
MVIPEEKHGLSTDIRDRSWIWNNPDWFSFYDISEEFLSQARELDASERKLEDLCSYQGFESEQLYVFAGNILASWDLEGIRLSRRSVRSSLADAVGLGIAEWKNRSGKSRESRAVAATLEMLSDEEPLTLDSILSSHAMLKENGDDDWGRLRDHAESVYAFDDEGRGYSVYDAPPQERVPGLMEQYVRWWQESKERLPRAAGAILAHLLFVVIHPFRDGNGRMARMLADRYLAEASRYMFRPYSLSVEIGRHKAEYYMALESITEARGMSRFLDFMLAMHATAIDVAMERAKLLERAHAFLAANDIRLSFPETELLHTLCANPGHRWSFIEATRDMEDDEEAEEAWNSLIEKGFVANGAFVIPDMA